MEKEFTAKTVDEAKALAAQEFGVSVDDIEFDILEQPRKGLFGMRGEARVKAIYEEKPVEIIAPEVEETAPAYDEEDT
ncbi:MAG: Jag N-terminal domain-containing protein, partial [Oscillospiraceae bacterium]|nr:Jag N-terminal domain-containing protein [Oscillospiraceae bacterium]